MRNRIDEALKNAEEKYNIEILYACESGSRAWGFPSPDSDYDVRFIYKRKQEDYLSILSQEDQIGFPINDELDLYGWDIKKVLQLIYKSNCTPFEWIQSPIIYQEKADFRNGLASLLPDYFDARKQIFHYLGIAKGAMESIEGESIKIKKLFYVLRPILAAKWIDEKMEYPPMNIMPMLDLVTENIRIEIEKLIEDKATKAEGFIITLSKGLKCFIDEHFETLTQKAANLSHSKMDAEKLDKYFKQCVLNLT